MVVVPVVADQLPMQRHQAIAESKKLQQTGIRYSFKELGTLRNKTDEIARQREALLQVSEMTLKGVISVNATSVAML